MSNNFTIFLISMVSLTLGLSSIQNEKKHTELKWEFDKLNISTEIIKKQNEEIKQIILKNFKP